MNPDQIQQIRIVTDGFALEAMAGEVEACNREKGWYEDQRTFGDECMLMVTEIAEAMEAFREIGFEERLRFTSESGGFAVLTSDDVNTKTWQERGLVGKPEGVASELADVLVRLLDTCKRHDIDLFAAWRQKVDYNWTRPYRHGGKAI